MLRLSAITVLACVTMAGSSAVFAADIIEQPPVFIEEAPPLYVPDTSGWYLRADVGYVFESETDADYKFYNQFPGAQGIDDIFHYDSIETDAAASFGIGAGYRFTDNFRMDATLDYFKTDVSGTSSCISYVTASMGLAFDNDCHYEDSSEVSVWTAMANAYVDLGTYGRFTPYIGAGIGAARVSWGEMRNEQVCGSDPACVGQENFVGTHEGEDSWRFASSLMAGASIDITQSLKFDAGYRYTRIAEGDAFGFDEADRSFGASGVQGRDHGFDIHTIRAGLRYEFGGGNGFGKGKAPAPIYADAPIYAQEPVYK